jgi:hypothetical protein
MARIRAFRRGDSTAVVVTGRLSAGDIGRLEHACAPALTTRAPRLEIDLSEVTQIDATAANHVARMGELGVRVTWGVKLNVDPAHKRSGVCPGSTSKE